MTKTKTFWAACAVLCLAAAALSGYSIYNRLTVYFSEDTLEVKARPAPPPLPDPEEEAAATAAEPETRQQIENPKAPEAPAEAPKKQRAVKTSFEYRSAAARRVSLAGSFTKWKEIRMTKKDGAWKAEVYILPGSYLYHFVVDGKKTPAPGKPRGLGGESVAEVPWDQPAAETRR